MQPLRLSLTVKGEGMPKITTRCADCGVGTLTIGEWYMAKDDVWEQAWSGRRKSWHGKATGHEILCIGCLENRIGRTLTNLDFTRSPINNAADEHKSDRLRNRLTTTEGPIKRHR
jgi:hypothetical protein